MENIYKMGCAMGFVKYAMFIFNLIFTIIGLALVILGTLFSVVITHGSNASPDVDNHVFVQIVAATIIIGVIVFVTSFLGCCGAVKENQFMLRAYAAILLTIFIVQLSTGIYALTEIGYIEQKIETVQNNIALKFVGASMFNDPELIDSRDLMQSRLKCCGASGPEIYGDIKPGSCCPSAFEPCPSDNNPFYGEGCIDKFNDLMVIILEVIGGVTIGTAVAEIIGAIFGFCLANSIGKIPYRRHLNAL